jgi:hypothetical protein
MVALFFYFILIYFHNTHQVLVRLPQGAGGLAISFYFILYYSIYFYITHQVLVRLPQGFGGLAFLLFLDYINCILVYFYYTHQVLVG